MGEILMWLIIFTNTAYLSWSVDEKIILVLEQYLKLDPRFKSTSTDSITVMITFWVLIVWANKSAEI